ncbi:hypothetical protein HID58_083367 [Brassica napus]|uniref:Mediator complex subunit 15 KIX domain-containing protein n=1 Tax=Brassica napus TaxID=3708 RepID=A0ABQ7YG25_BRANA|nr:hypothetical protein HID58_083367 [Brassica napus]
MLVGEQASASLNGYVSLAVGHLMDNNSWRPDLPNGDPSVDTGDWRSQLPPDSRQKIVNKIMETLKKHLPLSATEGVNELRRIAARFEEKIFSGAVNQSDYLRKISMKMLTMDSKSQNATGSSSSIPAANNVSSLDIKPNIQGHLLPGALPNNQSQAPPQPSLSQPMQSNTASGMTGSTALTNNTNVTSVSMLRQHQSSLLRQHPQSQQSSGIHQQQTSLPQQQPISPLQQQQAQMMRQQAASGSGIQQKQMMGQNLVGDMQQQHQQRLLNQQNNILNMQQKQQVPAQQQLMSQQNSLQTTHQQPLGTNHSNVAGLQQPQQQLLSNSSMQTNQQSVQHMLSQPTVGLQRAHQAGHGVFSSQGQQSQNQQMIPLQSHHQQLGLQQQQQPNLLQQDVQQRLQSSGQVTGSLLPPQSVVDQQRQQQLYQSQRTLPEMPSSSLDSTAQTESANGVDWQEEVYQKIQTMKEAYLPDLSEINQRVGAKLQQDASLPQQQRSEQFEKLKQFKNMLDRMIQFLSVPKINIMPALKDKVANYEKQIINFLNNHRPRRPIQQGQMQQQSAQNGQDQSHDSQANTQMQSMSMAGSVPRAQQSSLANMQNNVLSSRPGVSAPQQSIPASSLESGQGNAQMTQQHSSPQVDQKILMSSVNKMGTPLQPAHSPFVVPSPSTSLAPSPMQVDSEKAMGNTARQQQSVVQSIAIGTPGISASPLLQELTSPDGNNLNQSAAELPIERLIRVVKSISPQSLSSGVSDIRSVVSMVDRIAGSAPGNGSRTSVGEDLVAMTKCRLQARNLMTQEGMPANKKMKRHTTAMPLSVGDNYNQFACSETSDLESTATSVGKKARTETEHALLEEIKEINQRLIDTVVEISNDEDAADASEGATASKGCEGTTVRFSFKAVSLSPALKAHLSSTQMSPIQPLRLLVPCSYPRGSPSLLDNLPVETSKEKEDLSSKAMARFNILLRSLSQPMSLKDIAKTWEACARTVICEYAQQFGGGTFSSKYDGRRGEKRRSLAISLRPSLRIMTQCLAMEIPMPWRNSWLK